MDEFFVTYASSDQMERADSPIVMAFSQLVEAHHVEDFFDIRPKTAGIFAQGATTKEVVFVPASPFMEGVAYEFTLKSGLYSTLGKKLRDDYVSRFSVGYNDDTIRLVKDGDASYLFGVSDETALTFQVGDGHENVRAKIFSVSDPEILLQSFHNGFLHQEKGLPPQFPLDALTLVQEMTDIQTDDPLALPGPGLYLVRTVDSEGGGTSSWVVKSSFGAHFRQDDQGFFLGLEDFATGAPVDDGTAEVDIYTQREKSEQIEKLKTVTVKNLEYVPLAYPEKISAVVVTMNGETAVVPVHMYGSMAEIGVWRNLEHRSQIFLYKDKPLYRAGDTLHFRGLIRQDNDGAYSVPPKGKKISLDFGGTEPVVVETGRRGEFFGEWKIPKDESAGVRYVWAKA
ncbi:MAG: hypothetical protein AAB932_00005, partial [Patescibacteria group bacterium]